MQKFKRKKEERKKVVHATKSYYQKGKEKLKIERKKNTYKEVIMSHSIFEQLAQIIEVD